MNLRNDLRKLDPDVVDIAIELLVERVHYTCIALSLAAKSGYSLRRDPYVLAYHAVTCSYGFEPLWWNSPCFHHKQARKEALEDFRDAIVEAKKPTLIERIKAWVTAPCDYANFS